MSARRRFGGTAADWVFTNTGGTLAAGASTAVWFYNALSGGTRTTDLQTTGGGAISAVTTDSNGALGEFLGPAGVYRLAADANSGAGPRRWLVAQDLGNGLAVDITDYGGDPTGGSDSTPAFVAASADAQAAGGLRVHVPHGTYNVNAGKINAASGLWFDGDGYKGTILNISYSGAAPGYLFNCDPSAYSSSNHVENFRVTGMKINATGADIFWGSNLVRSMVTDNYLTVDGSHSVFNVSQSTGSLGTTYMAECRYSNREDSSASTRTTEHWHLDFSGSGMRGNDNIWEGGGNKIWNYPGAYWLRLIGDATILGSKHNVWRDMVFECSPGAGGFLWLQNTSECDLRNLSSEDLSSGTVSNPLIKLNAFSTGPGCHGINIDHYSRRSGNNISNSLPDILLDNNCSGITIHCPSHSSGGTNLTIDFGGATNCVRSGAWYEQGGSPVLLNTAGVNAYV